MIDLSAIENGVYAWCSTELQDTQFIFENQNAPIPEGSFGSINVVSVSKIGIDGKHYDYSPDTDKFTESIEGPREVLVSVNIFGAEAFNRCAQLQASTRKTSSSIVFYQNGISFVDFTAIRDLTEVISGEWEPRAQFDITFYVNSSYNGLIDRIDSAQIDGKYNDKQKQIIVESED